MPVLINFKICDNAEECNGIAICKTGALSWDEKNKTIIIDNSKCINCGLCEKSCMVQAIKVAKDEKEYQEFNKEIENDPRRVSDLYLDRYGAQPILPAFLISEDKFEQEVLKSAKLVAVEFFENEGIMCMLKSIPIKKLFNGIDIKYLKTEISKKLKDQYCVKELPALLFFKNGKLVGKIEGYFGQEQKDDFIRKIDNLLK